MAFSSTFYRNVVELQLTLFYKREK